MTQGATVFVGWVLTLVPKRTFMTFRFFPRIALVTLAVFLMTSCTTRNHWQVFVYPDGIATAVTASAIIEAAGPNFQSEEECRTWGSGEAARYAEGEYQCGLNCTFRPIMGEGDPASFRRTPHP